MDQDLHQYLKHKTNKKVIGTSQKRFDLNRDVQRDLNLTPDNKMYSPTLNMSQTYTDDNISTSTVRQLLSGKQSLYTNMR